MKKLNFMLNSSRKTQKLKLLKMNMKDWKAVCTVCRLKVKGLYEQFDRAAMMFPNIWKNHSPDLKAFHVYCWLSPLPDCVLWQAQRQAERPLQLPLCHAQPGCAQQACLSAVDCGRTPQLVCLDCDDRYRAARAFCTEIMRPGGTSAAWNLKETKLVRSAYTYPSTLTVNPQRKPVHRLLPARVGTKRANNRRACHRIANCASKGHSAAAGALNEIDQPERHLRKQVLSRVQSFSIRK